MSIEDKLTTIAENESKVYEAGKNAEWNKFWDAYQQNGTRFSYYYAFSGTGWNDETFYPKYDIVLKGSNIYAFAYCQVTDLVDKLKKCGVTLDTQSSSTNNYMFYSAQTKRLPPINLTGHWSVNGVFADCWNLESIEKIIVVEQNTFSGVFTNCPNLKNITFEGIIGQNGLDLHWSTKLTHDSLMNVINCLMAYVIAENKELTATANSTVMSNAKLIEGKNYLMEFRSYEFNGASSPLYVGSQNMTASKVNIEGVGERIGVWRECDFWADPDIYWYRVYVYQDGDDIKELRYRINKQTGEVIPHAFVGDILSLAVDQTATHSVTLGATNLAKLTDAEKAIATQKGWTLL